MYITDLRISNLKLLRDFHLPFGTADNPRMWTVLIGENGLCKTAILRAIAMAATGYVRANQLADAPSLPDRRRREGVQVSADFTFGAMAHKDRIYPGLKQRPAAPPLIRSALSITSGHSTLKGNSHYIKPDHGTNPEEIDPIEDAASRNLENWFVAGYGTSRLLPLPLESKRPKDPSRERLSSLFDQGSIIGTGFASFVNDPKAYGGALRSALVQHGMLPAATDIEVKGRNWAESAEDVLEGDLVSLRYNGNDFSVPATWLSQGYQSTISWIADIIGQFFFERKEHVPFDSMEGLVLIDEIDLHLHPAWQEDLIPLVKKVFPRLQFVVTTHSPMVLTGLAPDEIVRLRLDEKGHVVVPDDPQGAPALLTSSQIYDRYFGVSRVQAGRLGRALRRYSILALEGDDLDSEEQVEMTKLRQQLLDAGVDPDSEQ